MKRIILSILVVASLAISACGGSSVSGTKSQEQVRSLYYKVLTDMTSNHPSDMCSYYRPQDRDKCVGAMILAKKAGFSPGSLVSYNWKQRLAHAQIVINGNTATIVSGVATDKGGSQFTNIDGQWYKNGES